MTVDYILESWTLEKRKAAKIHQCVECNGPIAPGHVYNLGKGVSKENGWESFRFHLTCWNIREAQAAYLRDEVKLAWDELPGFGEMVEYAAEDASEAQDFPPYWPKGVYVSTSALRAYVAGEERMDG